jgi:small-conductance mechanosensitive channel
MNITKQKTISKVLAMWAKIIILFFTLIVVLNYTKLVDQVIINTILTWFIAMLTLAGGLAFGLWWKDIAKEILEGFKK